MEIAYKNLRMEQEAQNFKKLARRHGQDMAKKIMKRLQELDSAKNLQDIQVLPQYHLEKLVGNYEGHYSIVLNKQYRIIFLFENGEKEKLQTVTKIKIMSLCKDYH